MLVAAASSVASLLPMADLPAHFKLALELSPELETFTHLLLKAPIDRTERDVQQVSHYLVTTMQNP